MEKKKDYPHWVYPSKKAWLRRTRHYWSEFYRSMKYPPDENIMTGSAYYPKSVYDWLNKFRDQLEEVNKVMKDYYKNP